MPKFAHNVLVYDNEPVPDHLPDGRPMGPYSALVAACVLNDKPFYPDMVECVAIHKTNHLHAGIYAFKKGFPE